MRQFRRRLSAALSSALFITALAVAGPISILYSFGGTQSFATPTFVQGNGSATIGLSTATYAQAQNAGDANVVLVIWNTPAATVSSVTDTKNNTYTSVSSAVCVASTSCSQLWYATNIASAVAAGNTVSITFSTTVVGTDILLAEYSGVKAVSPVDQHGSAVATSGTALSSGTITTTQSHDLLVGAMVVQNAISAPGAGYTQRVFSAGDNILEDKNVTTTGTYSAGATQSASGYWAAQIVALKAAAPTPGPANPTFVQAAAGGVGSSTATFGSAQHSGDLNVVVVGLYGTTVRPSGVTDTLGNTYTQVSPFTAAALSAGQAVYAATGIAAAGAGANTVTVAWTGGTPGGQDVRIAEYSGAGALDVQAASGVTSATSLTSGTATTTNGTDLLVGGAFGQNGANTAGSGYTARVVSPAGQLNLLEDQNVTVVGSYAATASQPTAGYAITQMVAFRATGSGSSGGSSSSSSSSSSGSSSSSSSSSSSGGTFSVSVGSSGSANRLVNASATPIDLVGVNIYGLETITIQGSQTPTFSGYAGLQVPNFAKMASQGINVVRIPLNQNPVLGQATSDGQNWGGAVQTAYLNFLDSVVAAANAAGIYVDLDLHWTAPANFTASAQTYFPDNANGPSFWTKIATRYKSNPAVMFELFNEPNTVSDAVLDAGGAATAYVNSSGTHSFSYTYASYPAMLAAVRATGATNVVIFGSNNYSSTPTWIQTYNPTDTLGQLAINVAHQYPNAFYNLGTGSSSNSYSSANPLIQYIIARYPGLATEYGEGSGSDSGGLTSFSTGANTGSQSGVLTYDKQYHIGVMAWSYNPPNPPTQSSQNVVSDNNGTLTNWGTQFLAFF